MGRARKNCVNPLNLEGHRKKATNNIPVEILDACRIRKLEVHCVKSDRICYGCYWDLKALIKRTEVCGENDGQLEQNSLELQETGEEPTEGSSGIKRTHSMELTLMQN